jgi:uncharacterized membrane protein YgcG
VRLTTEPVSLRRLSRRFSTVGVEIPASRLREIADGQAATDDELVNDLCSLVQNRLRQRLEDQLQSLQSA